MTEAIRLVIWDLDETFWKGTLTEGGMNYEQDNHDIVVELARRGIMSSICSKNDFEPVKKILEDKGVWDYFIFPSINWEPKGPRIASLIEAVQLRPETILFIDDNPMNREEALHFSSGLQVTSEKIISEILDSPRFKGKDDQQLSRLKQYKLLERRKADEAVAVVSAGGSNKAFLRSSNIRVRIENDIEKHIDRAVELINRTNQLNFTKSRLPEDPEKARRSLREQISHFASQAGLIEVSDNYGDYGYCGFFQVLTRRDKIRLSHFCFSCRILNMGVEAWLYQLLGRPALTVRGEVLSDPIAAEPVDWIKIANDKTDSSSDPEAKEFSSVAARGGCVLWPLAHYFRLNSETVIGEFNIVRDGITIRLDHSLCLRHAIEGLSTKKMDAIRPLGYEPEDFDTKYFDYSGSSPVWIFSNWVDAALPLYRHKRTGIVIPFQRDDQETPTDRMRDAMRAIEADFEPAEYGEEEMKSTLAFIFSFVPPHGKMFVFLVNETRRLEDGRTRPIGRRKKFNNCIAEIVKEFPAVEVLRIGDFVESYQEIRNENQSHFDRMVYFRIFQHISNASAGRALQKLNLDSAVQTAGAAQQTKNFPNGCMHTSSSQLHRPR